LCIEVQDDGIGIEPERRKVLLVQGDAGAGVALLNIHQRMQHLYGTELKIQSTPGQGTTVRVIISGGEIA
ncbi:MAG: histidine kinase, partial [Bacillota bacterium]|nr:histidine kinase [Bacillota bacterium]